MRVHGDNKLHRRKWSGELKKYQDARKEICEDFEDICGYCGKDGKYFYENFHIDHFVPKRIAPELENVYENLVWACPRCNLVKSGKWPTEDKTKHNTGTVGFVDPASEEYDIHMERGEDGNIYGKTELGRSMCKNLNFHIRRIGLLWKIQKIIKIQVRMRELFKQHKLDSKHYEYYIMNDLMINDYFSKIGNRGE